MKFLIADDAGVMRKIITRALIELNVAPEDIVEAEDGRQAVEAAKQQDFVLIFMDWNMPNMLGIEAVSEIRAIGIKSPILMVTTEGEKTNVVRAIQAGATNYLIKPFTPDDIKTKITQMIGEISPQGSVSEPIKHHINHEDGKISLS